jgi:hypothetical protein
MKLPRLPQLARPSVDAPLSFVTGLDPFLSNFDT